MRSRPSLLFRLPDTSRQDDGGGTCPQQNVSSCLLFVPKTYKLFVSHARRRTQVRFRQLYDAIPPVSFHHPSLFPHFVMDTFVTSVPFVPTKNTKETNRRKKKKSRGHVFAWKRRGEAKILTLLIQKQQPPRHQAAQGARTHTKTNPT